MDPFTLALATFGVQKLRGKSTKRALRDAALIGGGSFALGKATQAGMLGGSSGFLGKVGTGNPFSGIKGLIGEKAVAAKAATTNAAGEVVPAVAEKAGSGILGFDTPTKFIAASTLLPLLSGGDEGDGQMEGYRKEDYDKAYKEQSEKLEGGFEPTKDPRPSRQETYGSNMFYANQGGLATAIKKFNKGGVNYLPSKTDHNEDDYNNYVRAEGYVEDGAGNGDKDEDTMLAQLADGEFVSRADAVLGAGILSGGDPKSYKSMRKAGASFFYDQQKKLKRIYDLVDASRKDN
tara:strand:- start:558 stop:1430 length:873 start_codon:yes stop_codon:yes gene_type:complete